MRIRRRCRHRGCRVKARVGRFCLPHAAEQDRPLW
jgi:hypothetical protein